MEKLVKNKMEPIILPKGKFATHKDGNTECCEYCEHVEDYKDGYLFVSDKVLCGLDGKWHDIDHICPNYK